MWKQWENPPWGLPKEPHLYPAAERHDEMYVQVEPFPLLPPT